MASGCWYSLHSYFAPVRTSSIICWTQGKIKTRHSLFRFLKNFMKVKTAMKYVTLTGRVIVKRWIITGVGKDVE